MAHRRTAAGPPGRRALPPRRARSRASRYEDARSRFKDIVARHPDSSYAPRARFLIGETYFREGEFDKAVKEFEAFLAFYPQHQIAASSSTGSR